MICSWRTLQWGERWIKMPMAPGCTVANGRPAHAARQLADGSWTSKCGRSEDIRHTLEGLAGDVYGEPTIFLSRPRSLV